MKRVLVLLAPGFEELEAVTVIDILRRAGVEVVVAGTTTGPIVGGHRIPLVPDTTLPAAGQDAFDMIVLPGGGEGTANLRRDSRVASVIRRHVDQGRYVAAICAAPAVLADMGLLARKRVTSYPAFQSELPGSVYSSERVVIDDRIVTSRSPGTALEFALTLVELLVGQDERRRIETQILAAGAPNVT